jgi:hypothetical protein
MDPITLAVPVLVVIGGKVVEKWGEKIGEKTFEAGEKLMQSIAHKSPETAEKLKQLEPGEIIDAEIVAEVRRIADAEPTVKAEVEAVATAATADQKTFENLTKLAEKIGVVNLGQVMNQTNNITI